MVGSILPTNITVPENMDIQIVFNGMMKSFDTKLDLNCSFGKAQIDANIDRQENFNSNLNITGFDLGSLLMDKNLFGPLSMKASISGHGLKVQTVDANIEANFTELFLNRYNYQNLNIIGQLSKEKFDGKISLKDDNLNFDFNGQVNIMPDQEAYKFDLNLLNAKLQRLNFSKDDINVGLKANVDLTGKSVDKLNGSAAVTNINIGLQGNKFKIDSLLFTSVNVPNNSELHFKSPFMVLNYKANLSPITLPSILNDFVNNYFPFSATVAPKKQYKASSFNFDLELKKHPVFTELLFPQLKVLEMSPITGRFDSDKKKMEVNATIKKIEYGSSEITAVALIFMGC